VEDYLFCFHIIGHISLIINASHCTPSACSFKTSSTNNNYLNLFSLTVLVDRFNESLNQCYTKNLVLRNVFDQEFIPKKERIGSTILVLHRMSQVVGVREIESCRQKLILIKYFFQLVNFVLNRLLFLLFYGTLYISIIKK
jgi:hypothetical protein